MQVIFRKNKANSVSSQIKENALIISADTVIYMNGKIYEKLKELGYKISDFELE